MTKANKRTLWLIATVVALVAVVAGVVPCTFALAATQDDPYAQYFSGGNGTASDPYQISSEYELRNINYTMEQGSDGYYYINSNFKLTSDITLTYAWTPFNGHLRGTIDGNGKTIRNMTLTSASNIDQGFVGTIDGGTVKNLNFNNASVTYSGTGSEDGVGIGVIAGTNHGFITNCSVTNSTVTASATNYDCNVGGICGTAVTGHVLNCTSTVTVSGSGSMGGICGYVMYNGTIVGSTNYGNVTGSGSIGGIAGTVSISTISESDNRGTISYLYDGNSGNAGGIAGEAKRGSLIEECKNYGSVKYGSATNNDRNFKPCIAQIVGLSDNSTVQYCSAFGNTDFTNLKKFFLGPDQKQYCSNDLVGRII